jgi:outer membrane murein-binding lipoprotein Lpp
MKYILLATILLTTGCATNSDIVRIQTQIDDIKPQLAQISKDTTEAKESALRAFTVSEKLYEAHEKLNAKLNKYFKKAQYK